MAQPLHHPRLCAPAAVAMPQLAGKAVAPGVQPPSRHHRRHVVGPAGHLHQDYIF